MAMRRRTGATALIEPVLPKIYELRAQKHSWAAIAAAFAKQGVIQGDDGEAITGRRLTALISAINKRLRRQEERLAQRAKRRDIAALTKQMNASRFGIDHGRMDSPPSASNGSSV